MNQTIENRKLGLADIRKKNDNKLSFFKFLNNY